MKKGALDRPASWTTQPLAKLAAVFTDGNWIESKDQADSGIRLVQTGNVGIGEFKDRSEKSRFIDEATFARLECFEILPGDILISRLPDPVGRACIIPDTTQKMITAVDCSIVRVQEDVINPKFLVYYSQTRDYLRAVDIRCSGTTRQRISRKNLGDVPVSLPSLAEQKRIVAVLDQAFAALDRARALAEANLADARDLFDSTRQELVSAAGGGRATSLGNEIELLVGFAFKSSGYVEAGDSIRLLRGDNIVQGAIRWDDAKHWPAGTAGDYGRFSLREGDVVLAMDRPWVKAGLKRALLQTEDVPALLVQRTACLRAGAGLHNRYLFQLISGDEFSRHLLGVQTGIGVPHISGQQIKDFTFTLPPLAEQRRIVSKIDELHTEIVRLEALYTRKLADLATLRQSLLQKAFAGELT